MEHHLQRTDNRQEVHTHQPSLKWLTSCSTSSRHVQLCLRIKWYSQHTSKYIITGTRLLRLCLALCNTLAARGKDSEALLPRRFTFVTTLTLIHTLFTWAGMVMLAKLGFFQTKSLSPLSVAPLAFGYVGYIILNNLSLNFNTVRALNGAQLHLKLLLLLNALTVSFALL